MYKYNVEKVTNVPNPAEKAKEHNVDFAKAHVELMPATDVDKFSSGPLNNVNANYQYVQTGNVAGNFNPKTRYQYNQFVGPANLFIPYSQTA